MSKKHFEKQQLRTTPLSLVFGWTHKKLAIADSWKCERCTYDNNPHRYLACDMCNKPKEKSGEDDKGADEVEHAAPKPRDSPKRKRDSETDLVHSASVSSASVQSTKTSTGRNADSAFSGTHAPPEKALTQLG
jgi:hypothetical protein